MNFEEKNHLSEWEIQWMNKAAEVEKIIGKLGNPVNEGVKDAVIGLQAFGINTTSSCEGRLSDVHRVPVPYIDVESPDAEKLSADYEKKYGGAGDYNEPIAEDVNRLIALKNLEERAKLIPLLNEFYRERKTSYDTRLVLESRKDNATHITVQGAFLQENADDGERRANLARFQEEMRAFGDFLKKKYLSGQDDFRER